LHHRIAKRVSRVNFQREGPGDGVNEEKLVGGKRPADREHIGAVIRETRK